MEHPLLYINIPGFPPHVTYTFVIMILLGGFSFLVSKRLSLVPSGGQSFLEVLVGGIANFMDENMGPGGRRYIPLIGSLFVFILASNYAGLIPGSNSPTGNINTNAAMALVVFLTYNYIGVRKHGVIGYLKTFTGPVWWLAPLIFPLEIITHLARPVTLTLRLFGNVHGEDLVLIILGILIPFLLPVPMLFLMVFTSTIQAVIFSLLSMFYIAGALEEGH